FLCTALQYALVIKNPYVERTKSEVVKLVGNSYPELIPQTSSCWKNARLGGGATHCGECVPCYVRRIAIEYLGPDPTLYKRDVWTEDFAALSADDAGRRNLFDLAAFRWTCENESAGDLMFRYPELIRDSFDGQAVIKMYKRWADEAKRVWSCYPKLAALL